MTASPPEPGTASPAGTPNTLKPPIRLCVLAALAALAIIIYSNSLFNGFTLDSSFILLRDPRIQTLNPDNLRLIFTKDYWYPSFNSGLFRPITTFSFLINYAVLGNGANPFGYHVVNLLLHIGNAWLVFALAWRFLRKLWPAVFAAALWTAHPIATEAVTNLVGRCDELAAVAVLGGTLLYIRATHLEGWRCGFAATGLFLVSLIGLLSKEFAVGLIAVMLLWDIVRGPSTAREWLEKRWPYYLAVTISLAIVFTARGFVFRAAPPAEFPVVDNPLVGAPFLFGRLTALKVVVIDLAMLIFPLNLTCDRSYNQIPVATMSDWAAWGSLAIVIGLLAAVIVRRRKDPLLFWCAGFFGITLLPVSNLVITIGSIMAERFLYLPAAAFSIAVSALLFRSRLRRSAPIILGLVVALFGVRTFLRNPDWRDDYSLAIHDVKVSPASFKLHGLVARAVLDKSIRNIDQAVDEAEKAWEIGRQLPPVQVFTQTPTNLGAIYRIKGDTVGGPRTAQGAEWYRRSLVALEEAKRDSLVYGDNYDDKQEAENKPMAIRLERADLYLNLGITYNGIGAYDKARDALIYGRKLTPNNLEFYNALATNYLDGGNPIWSAISLEERLMLDGAQPKTVDELKKVLPKIPNSGCVLAAEGGVTKLNVGCPAANICLVWTDLAQAYYRGRLRTDAMYLKKQALSHGCPAQLLDFAAPGN
jgi:tetratricopeptide (TPR) repeat protein